MNVTTELESQGFKVYEAEAEDRQAIDFSISDAEDNVAWVWGDDAKHAEVECNHPMELVTFGDDDERGECLLCGATCDWGHEKEIVDNFPDSIDEIEVRVPHTWHMPKTPKGMIKLIIEERSQL